MTWKLDEPDEAIRQAGGRSSRTLIDGRAGGDPSPAGRFVTGEARWPPGCAGPSRREIGADRGDSVAVVREGITVAGAIAGTRSSGRAAGTRGGRRRLRGPVGSIRTGTSDSGRGGASAASTGRGGGTAGPESGARSGSSGRCPPACSTGRTDGRAAPPTADQASRLPAAYRPSRLSYTGRSRTRSLAGRRTGRNMVGGPRAGLSDRGVAGGVPIRHRRTESP
jgi:hypothetical protein